MSENNNKKHESLSDYNLGTLTINNNHSNNGNIADLWFPTSSSTNYTMGGPSLYYTFSPYYPENIGAVVNEPLKLYNITEKDKQYFESIVQKLELKEGDAIVLFDKDYRISVDMLQSLTETLKHPVILLSGHQDLAKLSAEDIRQLWKQTFGKK